MKPFKPMLAVACDDLTKVKYPVILSEKLDGIRMVVKDGVAMSRSMKAIPSKAVQEKFGKPEYEGYDGEIIYGNKNAKDVFNKSTRACMSHELPEGFDPALVYYYVFDTVSDKPFSVRLDDIKEDLSNGVFRLWSTYATSDEEVTALEEEFLSLGAEGVMLRLPTGPYKQGRSTLKEGYLLKVKRFTDEEAKVIGFDERMHNANEATVGELGQTKRSSHQENMIPCNTLGALVVYSEKWGEFRIGTGYDDALRKEIWDNREKYIGKLAKFKYFQSGVVDKPRHPVFLGVRMEEDMSE